MIIKKTVGLRVSAEEEIVGLDATEHGLPSAYAGFAIQDMSATMDINENTDLGEGSYENATEAQKAAGEYYRGVEMDATLLPKVKVEVIVSKIPVDKVIEAAKKALYTGHIGDGKIFVYNVMKVVKVRTGEEDYAALQDVE